MPTPLRVPHEAGVLVQRLAGPGALDISLAEAGVLLLDESHLLRREFDLLLGGFLFQLEPPLVSASDPLLVEDVLDGGGAHPNALQLQPVTDAVTAPRRAREAHLDDPLPNLLWGGHGVALLVHRG